MIPLDDTPPGATVKRAITDLSQVQADVDAIKKHLANTERECLKHDYQEQELRRRLDEGAKHFSALDARCKAIEDAQKPASPWRLVPYAAAVLVFVAGIIWQAARYPTWEDAKTLVQERSPYLQDRPQVMKVVDAYTNEMPGVRLKLGVIDYKLDTILGKLEKGQ